MCNSFVCLSHSSMFCVVKVSALSDSNRRKRCRKGKKTPKLPATTADWWCALPPFHLFVWGLGPRGSGYCRETQSHFQQFLWEDTAPFLCQRCNLSSMSWVCPGVFSLLDMPETPPEGGIVVVLNECLSHLRQLFLMWSRFLFLRSCWVFECSSLGSTPSSTNCY